MEKPASRFGHPFRDFGALLLELPSQSIGVMLNVYSKHATHALANQQGFLAHALSYDL